MYIIRQMEEKIHKYLKTKEIIAIIGVRQCGKTTLMKKIFKQLKNANFLDFEDREKLELFEDDLDSFIKLYIKYYDYLFIDEFQYARDGGKKLKYIFDTQKIKIFISGSSSSELSIQSIQHLVGRIFLFQLNPFSFKEFLSFKDKQLFDEVYSQKVHSHSLVKKFNQLLNEFLIYGGFPRVVISESDEEKQVVLRNIYDTYFIRELKTIFNLASDFNMSKFMSALALQIGGMLNLRELSSTTGMRYPELMKYLNILHKTFIILESKPFYKNKRTELVKSPKIYYLDNGLRNAVIKNFQKINIRPDAGFLRENFVASELIKNDIELRHWRTKSKAEVDFIMEKNGDVIPLEIKSGLKTSKITKSFRSFIEKYHPQKGFVACENLFTNQKISDTSVFWIPLYHLNEHI
jgi:uncharacterized protein